MRITKKQIKTNWFRILVITIICFLSFIAVMVFREVGVFKENKAFFEEQYMTQMKEDLKVVVDNRIDEINYERSELEHQGQIKIYDRIESLEQLILDDSVFNSLSNQEMKEDRAINLILDYETLDKEQLYFAFRKDGTLLISGADRSMEGRNLLGARDADGQYFVQEMIDKVQLDNEGYETYYWKKTLLGDPIKKTSYFRYVKEIDMIIGTGFYFDDLDRALRDDIFERFQAYYAGKEDYVFMVTYDGIAKVFGVESLVNQDVSKVENIDGESIHTMSMNKILDGGSGYISYYFYERGHDATSQKISYLRGIDEWNVYIGMGFYINDFYEEVSAFEQESFKSLMNHTLNFVFVFLIVLSILVYYGIKSFELNKKYFKQEELLYEKFADLTTEGIFIVDEQGTVIFTNRVAKNMLQMTGETLDKLNIDHLLKPADEGYTLYGLEGQTMAVEVYQNEIFYLDNENRVLFITDVTNKLAVQKELENLAVTDELTELGNRRKFMESYHHQIEKQKRTHLKFCMAYIDLDHFKQINDKFGHDVGDQVLHTFGVIFNAETRDHDTLYRYGGEEFMAILEDSELENAHIMLERFNASIQSHDWSYDGLEVSCTAGLVEVDPHDVKMLEDYFKLLDQLLYKGKQSGRKCIVSQ